MKPSLHNPDQLTEIQSASEKFDFDEWQDLAQNYPEKFEMRRQSLIEKTINRAAPEYRVQLRRMQWQIDAVRRVSKNPLDACVRVYEMMLTQTFGENGLLDVLQQFTGRNDYAVMVGGGARREKARILPFRPIARQ